MKKQTKTEKLKVSVNRGREKDEKVPDMSPNKAKELKGVLDLLKNEKEKLIDEMRSKFFLFPFFFSFIN